MTIARAAALAALCIAFAGCTEKPQTAENHKADTPPWQGTQTSFSTQTWKQGDQAGWDAQMQARAQGQNEYTRSPPIAK